MVTIFPKYDKAVINQYNIDIANPGNQTSVDFPDSLSIIETSITEYSVKQRLVVFRLHMDLK